jgi:hypothetical protein
MMRPSGCCDDASEGAFAHGGNSARVVEGLREREGRCVAKGKGQVGA